MATMKSSSTSPGRWEPRLQLQSSMRFGFRSTLEWLDSSLQIPTIIGPFSDPSSANSLSLLLHNIGIASSRITVTKSFGVTSLAFFFKRRVLQHWVVVADSTSSTEPRLRTGRGPKESLVLEIHFPKNTPLPASSGSPPPTVTTTG